MNVKNINITKLIIFKNIFFNIYTLTRYLSFHFLTFELQICSQLQVMYISIVNILPLYRSHTFIQRYYMFPTAIHVYVHLHHYQNKKNKILRAKHVENRKIKKRFKKKEGSN